MKLTTLEKLLEDQVKDLYSAETQITKALPKIIKRATTESLKEGLQNHLEETHVQIERLDQIGEILGIKMTGKKCKAMEGLLEEGKEVLEAEGDDDIIDAALIGACQKVEHYEIGAYGTARTIAQQLGQDQIAELLQETLAEEGAADEKLTEVAESDIYPQLMSSQKDEDDAEEMDEAPARGRGRRPAGSSR